MNPRQRVTAEFTESVPRAEHDEVRRGAHEAVHEQRHAARAGRAGRVAAARDAVRARHVAVQRHHVVHLHRVAVLADEPGLAPRGQTIYNIISYTCIIIISSRDCVNIQKFE